MIIVMSTREGSGSPVFSSKSPLYRLYNFFEKSFTKGLDIFSPLSYNIKAREARAEYRRENVVHLLIEN